MDGLPENLKPAATVTCQRTLKSAISCVGVGLHSGQRVNLTLLPAEAGTGIVFRRTDLNLDIPARWDMVADTSAPSSPCPASPKPASAPSNT